MQMENLEKHWLEYPKGIPIESWGKDHLSTLIYAETRAVDYNGHINDVHMRVDRKYPTRLNNGVTVAGHTDYDCLADAQAAGLLTFDGTTVKLTDDGWAFVGKLRRARAEKEMK
jgi:hypothetical protein